MRQVTLHLLFVAAAVAGCAALIALCKVTTNKRTGITMSINVVSGGENRQRQ